MKTLSQTTGGEVVVNSSQAPSSNYDLCLIFDFKTIDDLNSYQADPVHQRFVKFITSVRESRACIDPEIQ